MVLESSGAENKALSQKITFQPGIWTRNHHHRLRLEKSIPKVVLESSGVENKVLSQKNTFEEDFGPETITINFVLKNRYQKWS